MPITTTQLEAIKLTSKVQDFTVNKLGMGQGCQTALKSFH